MALFGLLDFAKDMGRKLFSRDDDAAEKIKQHINEQNPGLQDFDVSFKDGTVNITGKAASAEALQKAVLMAGNVKGVENVNVDGVTAPESKAKVEYYVIVKGDTLSGIAKKFYGNAMEYPKLFEANREVIKDPDLIFPGQKIRIPRD